MKKFFGVVAVSACLSLGVADEAKAAGPFVVTFASFCDCITVYTGVIGGHSWLYGTWDWTCAGAPPYTTVAGSKDGTRVGTRPTVPVDPGFNAVFDFTNGSSGLFDLAGTFSGGAGDLFLFQDDQAFTVAAGSCPGAPANGMPPLTAQN